MGRWTKRAMGLAVAAGLAGCAMAASVFDQPKMVRAEGAEAGEWTQDSDAGLALAAAEGLPIVANFTGSDWCYWCKLMDRRVFSTMAWRKWEGQKKAVLLWVDFPQDKARVPEAQHAKNRALAEKFGVRGYPTYYVLAPDGETVLGRLGASQDATAEGFCAELDGVLNRWAAEKAGGEAGSGGE